jgi:hypothetical protein
VGVGECKRWLWMLVVHESREPRPRYWRDKLNGNNKKDGRPLATVPQITRIFKSVQRTIS